MACKISREIKYQNIKIEKIATVMDILQERDADIKQKVLIYIYIYI